MKRIVVVLSIAFLISQAPVWAEKGGVKDFRQGQKDKKNELVQKQKDGGAAVKAPLHGKPSERKELKKGLKEKGKAATDKAVAPAEAPAGLPIPDHIAPVPPAPAELPAASAAPEHASEPSGVAISPAE